MPELFARLYVPIAGIESLNDQYLPPSMAMSSEPPDSVLDMLAYLPSLHLSLLIVAARLDAIYNATIFTFSIVYNHYSELVSRARLEASAAGSIAQASKIWDKEIAAEAWEELIEWEIIVPAPLGKGSTEGLETMMWRCDVVLEEIVDAVGGTDGGMSDMMVRWCKEV